MNGIKKIGQHALWAITGTPGQRYVRKLQADVSKLSRARQCVAFGVSIYATDQELDQARAEWNERCQRVAQFMDETGAATPEQATATIRQWKRNADRAEALERERDAIKAEIAATKGTQNADAN